MRAEQVCLLYVNASTAVTVTILVSSTLACLQWRVIPHAVVLGWLAYMIIEALWVTVLAARFRRDVPDHSLLERWETAFNTGSALSACGWGAAAILLYPANHPSGQLQLAFVIGGMMLGAGSILASRPPVFSSFIVLSGAPLAVRFLLRGNPAHRAEGMLILLFTVAVWVSTWHIHQALTSALMLRFEKDDLMGDLQSARERLRALGRDPGSQFDETIPPGPETIRSLADEVARDVNLLITSVTKYAAQAEALSPDAGDLKPRVAAHGRRGRKSMGLAEREQVSIRMKNYWARIRETEEAHPAGPVPRP
ncbi:MAG TPA: hypothetical protein VJ732_04445 [Bryobacteraceae bacterium]|nr:hypothetical protein [Bryobacteraceae bacterium]